MKKNGTGAVAIALAGLTLALVGCTLGPQAREASAVYDLGPPRSYPPSNPPIPVPLLIPSMSAPSWLETNGILYRLSYQEAARPQVYNASRWAAPPAALLTQRLRSRFAAATPSGIATGADGARTDYALHVDLEDFSQVFDAPGSSRVAVSARATLVDLSSRALLAQRTFALQRSAPSADARGAVQALAEASDELVQSILGWTGERLAAARSKPGAGK